MKRMAVALTVLMVLGSFAYGVEEPSEKKIAVVALSVNDWSNSLLAAGGNPDTARLVDENTLAMLEATEETLGQYWTVVKAEEFIGNEAFRELSIGHVMEGLYAPKIDEQELPSFTENRKEIIKSVLTKETAQSLCQTLKVDVVVVIYSEWAVAQGGFVPTNKALAKNCVAMYSSSGKQLFFARKDIKGKRTLGAMGRIALNEDTIGEWVEAYKTGFQQIVEAKKKVVK
jgi:hypothetical protein